MGGGTEDAHVQAWQQLLCRGPGPSRLSNTSQNPCFRAHILVCSVPSRGGILQWAPSNRLDSVHPGNLEKESFGWVVR